MLRILTEFRHSWEVYILVSTNFVYRNFVILLLLEMDSLEHVCKHTHISYFLIYKKFVLCVGPFIFQIMNTSRDNVHLWQSVELYFNVHYSSIPVSYYYNWQPTTAWENLWRLHSILCNYNNLYRSGCISVFAEHSVVLLLKI